MRVKLLLLFIECLSFVSNNYCASYVFVQCFCVLDMSEANVAFDLLCILMSLNYGQAYNGSRCRYCSRLRVAKKTAIGNKKLMKWRPIAVGKEGEDEEEENGTSERLYIDLSYSVSFS